MSFREAIASKILFKDSLERRLSPTSIERARLDFHAKRRPRPCGLTVHPCLGCPNRCAYCYIQDMGFDFVEAKPYGLSGDELSLALLYNPWFMPGRMGTFLAFGSIAEPFNPKCIDRSIEYFMKVRSLLGNPCQFSTKMDLSMEVVERLSPLRDSLSPLITITTLKNSGRLEPKAPPPELRLEAMRRLREGGFKPTLFLRPIIPGITDSEAEDIFREAKKAGAVGVVAGGLRVTDRILQRLKASGIDLKPVMERVHVKEIGYAQVAIRSGDLKRKALKLAEERGLIPFPSACCANAYNAKVPCMNLCWTKNLCASCPNRCSSKLERLSSEDFLEAAHKICGVKPLSADEGDSTVKYTFTKEKINKARGPANRNIHLLQLLLRRRIILSPYKK